VQGQGLGRGDVKPFEFHSSAPDTAPLPDDADTDTGRDVTTKS
jgi:hypothetical protein